MIHKGPGGESPDDAHVQVGCILIITKKRATRHRSVTLGLGASTCGESVENGEWVDHQL